MFFFSDEEWQVALRGHIVQHTGSATADRNETAEKNKKKKKTH
jgi:hypothetical protein